MEYNETGTQFCLRYLVTTHTCGDCDRSSVVFRHPRGHEIATAFKNWHRGQLQSQQCNDITNIGTLSFMSCLTLGYTHNHVSTPHNTYIYTTRQYTHTHTHTYSHILHQVIVNLKYSNPELFCLYIQYTIVYYIIYS